MNRIGARTGIGGRQAKREVIDVPEKRPQDKTVDVLHRVRKQRLDRFEQERLQARTQWREARADLREAKQSWRQAKQDAKDFWQEARAGFFGMVTTSGEFRRAKATYQRMKDAAAQRYVECLDVVKRCKETRSGFFEAGVRLREGQREYEKLGMLREELRALNLKEEM